MLLDGREIADFIKQRHFLQVQGLSRQPRLAIINVSTDPATETYLRAKKNYGQDIGVAVEVYEPQSKTAAIIEQVKDLSSDDAVNGIVVQLPLPDNVDTDKILSSIDPAKDIDGLGSKAEFDPATPTGILWLLSAYQIDFKAKTVTVVGQGRLVGEPLSQMLEDSGARVIRCDIDTKDLRGETLKADIVVGAAGQEGLIKPGMVKPGTVVVDAAGDVDPELYQDDSLKITPTPGGVGPMTVAALYENLLRAVKR